MKERTNLWMKKSAFALALLMVLMMVLAGCDKGEQKTPDTTAATTQEQVQNAAQVSIAITCKSAAENMDKVPANKKEFVPENGIIFSKENVSIQSGETVFEFIKKVCSENNIQMDYAEGMIYVKSLGNLNEKDCGAESGWMYKVNGESPSVGVDQYTLKDGDKVEFFYILTYAEAM